MKTVHKYPIEIKDEQKVKMPEDAKILTAQFQHEELQLWALVDTKKRHRDRTIRIFGTGYPAEYENNLDYIITIQHGMFVWHIFEEWKL